MSESVTFADSRRIYPVASFSFVDSSIAEDCTPTPQSEFTLSDSSLIVDDSTYTDRLYPILEHNFWVLDGRCQPISDYAGWCGNTIAGNDGTINESLTLTFDSSHSSYGLTIEFYGDSYPTEFIIQTSLNGVNGLTYNCTNSGFKFELAEALGTYDAIYIVFNKMSAPKRRVRLARVIFGISETFDDKSIVDFTITKEISSKCDTIPIGELTMTVDNSNHRYDIMNPQGAYGYLKFGMPIKMKIGIATLTSSSIEWHQVGTYYFYKAETTNDGLTATFTFQDVMTYLERAYYYGLGGTLALGNVIAEINAIVPNLTWDNQTNLINFKGITQGDKISLRELLTKGCEACRAVSYAANDGTIIIKHLEAGQSTFAYTFDRMVENPVIEADQRITKATVVFDTPDGLASERSKSRSDIDPSEIPQEERRTFDLVGTNALADACAEYMLTENDLYKYSFTGRGNPELDITDTIMLFDKYETQHEAIVTAHTLKYDGGLTEEIKAVGGIYDDN